MQRALGPFLATGVALVAATVVVANPVAPPSRDMQISTTQLSTSPDLLSPSDKSLLSALTPQLPLAGIGPALAQILAALAADADRISREVASAASPQALGPDAPSATAEQTAYRADQIGPPVLESPGATPIPPTTGFSSAVLNTGVAQVLTGLVADTSYLGGKVVEAAYAAVAVIIRAPQFVVAAVADLLAGNLAGALDTVRSAIKEILGPVIILADGIRDVLFGRQQTPASPPTGAKSVVNVNTAVDGTQVAGESKSTNTTRHSKADPAKKEKRAGTQSAAAQQPTTTSKTAAAPDSKATLPKASGSGKPAAGTARSAAGSPRNGKSAAGADS